MRRNVDYIQSSNALDQPSPIIWADCPLSQYLARHGDAANAVYFGDRFEAFPNASAPATAAHGKWEAYGDTGVVIGPDKDETLGIGPVCKISGNDADNDEGNISGPSNCFRISDTGGELGKLWFECRLRKASVADNGLALFAGLGWDLTNNVSLAKADALVDNTGAIGAFSMIGFHVDHANGDSVDFVYRADGQAATVPIAGLKAIAADTFYNLGFVYDPQEVDAKKIKVYVDGVEDDTYVTATDIAAATFPDDEWMAPCYLTKVGAAAEVKNYLKFMEVFQLSTLTT